MSSSFRGYGVLNVSNGLMSNQFTQSVITAEGFKPIPPPLKSPLPCPCLSSSSYDLGDQVKLDNRTSQMYSICVGSNEETTTTLSKLFHDHMKVNIEFVHLETVQQFLKGSYPQDSNFSTSFGHCDVLVNVLSERSNSVGARDRRCPGVCLPIPFAEVPLYWMLPPYKVDRPLTCSMSMPSVLSQPGFEPKNRSTAASANNFALMLQALARRRMEECSERGRWPMGTFNLEPINSSVIEWTNHSYLLPLKSSMEKRKVYGLIVWVGSTRRMDLSRHQTDMLTLQENHLNDSQKIFGWIANEDVYPCNPLDAHCPHKYGYHWMMPSTLMYYEGQKGYGCGQRRPLRAMTHVLLLFDPDFLFLVDDDTYVRVNHLFYGSPLSYVILGPMKTSKIAMGELTGGNKVTNHGFFFGGSGYLMGRGTLDALNSHVIAGPGLADKIRNEKHVNHLGLFEEAREMCNKSCSDCFEAEGDYSLHGVRQKANILVRLVDLCTNMLSESGTCYHSDHAISRCLIHAVYVDVWNVPCSGTSISTDPPFSTGMCMGVKNCTEDLLTCHRWWPDISFSDLPPIPYVPAHHAQGSLSTDTNITPGS